jgi:hypothetical protein
VKGIFIGPEASGPLHRETQVEAVAGRGLRGDRYFVPDGSRSDVDWRIDLTLFESEALDGLRADTGIELAPNEIRRNVMTRGVALNDLVGRRFRVGEVEALGIERCDPCNHLQKLTKLGVLRGLVNRGGLRVAVIKGGVIRIGDVVEDLGSADEAPDSAHGSGG